MISDFVRFLSHLRDRLTVADAIMRALTSTEALELAEISIVNGGSLRAVLRTALEACKQRPILPLLDASHEARLVGFWAELRHWAENELGGALSDDVVCAVYRQLVKGGWYTVANSWRLTFELDLQKDEALARTLAELCACRDVDSVWYTMQYLGWNRLWTEDEARSLIRRNISWLEDQDRSA